MKKFFILASAAIVALASCSKTQVVYNDAPEEISFKKITNVMTKGTIYDPSSEFEGAIGVYAEGAAPFANAQFTKNGTTWTGNKYWPVSGELKFTLYAPYDGTENSPGRVSYASDKLTMTVSAADQIDWLYGTTQPSGTKEDEGESMSVVFAHALSQIVVTVSGDANVTLKSVALKNTVQSATGTVTYTTNSAGAVNWTDNTTLVTSSPLYSEETTLGSTTVKATPWLVVPSTIDATAAIELKYQITGSPAELTYTTPTGVLGTQWNAGSKYTYNFIVGAKEIKFTPTVTEWDDDDNDGGEGDNTTGVNVTPNTSTPSI